MSNEAIKYTKSATVERAREMLKRLHDRNQRTWDDLDRDVAFAIEALIDSAERYRFIAHGTQAEQVQPVKVDKCANCLRPKHEHWNGYCPKPYQTVWHDWDYEEADQAQPVCLYCGGDRFTAPPQRQPLTDEQLMTEKIDAAMVATRKIYPPITRNQCRLIIEAAQGIRSAE